MKKRISAIVCVIAACLLTGCGKNGSKTDVRIAYFPNVTHAQALVLKNNGDLEEKLGDSCKVTWTEFNAGPAEVEAIFAGEIDLGYIGPIPAISANVKSEGDVQIIAGAANAGAVLAVRKESGIGSVADLDGKKIAIPQLGNTQHLSLLNLLSENNLKVTDKGGSVQIVATQNSDIMNLMEQKEIDAALVPEPWGATLEEKADAEILLDYDEVWRGGDYPTAVVVVNEDFRKEHEDIVAQFLQAHSDATVYINEHKDEAKEIINQEIEAATGKAIDGHVLDTSFKRLIVTDEIPETAIWDFADVYLKEGFITKLPEEDLFWKSGEN